MRIFALVVLVCAMASPVSAQVSGPWARVVFGSDTGPSIVSGTASPESVVSATTGSIYLQTNGTGVSVLWTKVGSGTTGWQFSGGVGTSTVADSGSGSAAVATLTPTTRLVKLTCSDADGCTMTLDETGMLDGQEVEIVNVSANTANFADTTGVTELTGAFAAGQWDALKLRYVTDRWVEISRSNN